MESQCQKYPVNYAIDEETALLQTFFNNVDQYQVLLNKQLEIVAFNVYAFNFSKQVLKVELKKGKNVAEFMDRSFNAHFKTLCNKALTGTIVHFEHFINGLDDKKMWLDFTIYPLNTVKQASGLMLVGNNINNQKKREKIIRHQTESLSVIAQLQSHQVRQPVSSILGILNLIKEENFDLKKEYILGLETATKQLDEVIRAIVAQSRKE